jgi:hypothetical protein
MPSRHARRASNRSHELSSVDGAEESESGERYEGNEEPDLYSLMIEKERRACEIKYQYVVINVDPSSQLCSSSLRNRNSHPPPTPKARRSTLRFSRAFRIVMGKLAPSSLKMDVAVRKESRDLSVMSGSTASSTGPIAGPSGTTATGSARKKHQKTSLIPTNAPLTTPCSRSAIGLHSFTVASPLRYVFIRCNTICGL